MRTWTTSTTCSSSGRCRGSPAGVPAFLVRIAFAAVLLAATVLASGPALAQRYPIPAGQRYPIPAETHAYGPPRSAVAGDAGRRLVGASRRPSRATPRFDASYYHLRLDVRFDPDRVSGRVRVAGRITEGGNASRSAGAGSSGTGSSGAGSSGAGSAGAGSADAGSSGAGNGTAIDSLRLDLRSANVSVDSVRTFDGERLSFRHADDVLTVALAQPAGANARIDLEIFYTAEPPTGTGGFVDALTFDRSRSGRPVAWTLSEPYGARTWWPGKDHPSDKADSARVTVTVPASMRVASNGLLESTETVGERSTFTWFSRYPIAPYLISFAAAEYEVSEQIYARPDSLAEKRTPLGPDGPVERWGALELPILHYTYPDRSFLAGFERVREMLPVMEYWFGPYPFPEEKYGHAQFTWGGGMEHQTMSSMGGSYRGLLAHELAHMWFGDAITLRRWPHLWLNEGFATYAELLFWEARREKFPGRYENVYELYRERARGYEGRDDPGPLIVEDTSSVGNLFRGDRVYAKGAMVLHMLRDVVGTATFREILRAYARHPRLRHGTAVSGDFRRVAEAVSGRDLEYFFDQWLRRPGYPIYDVEWTGRSGPEGPEARILVRQLQEEPPFRMPVTLELETATPTDSARTVRRRVEVSGRVDTLNVPLPGTPVTLRFDPERTILRNDSIAVREVDRLAGPPPSRLRLDPPFPNPAGDVARVELGLPEEGPVTLVLYDALGRRVRSVLERPLDAGSHLVRIPLDDLPAGTYFLHLRTDRNKRTRSLTRVR